MLELKRLSYFKQVVEDGSLSKASKSLHIAQPALSRQIHLLEDYLGLQLFVRTGRGMRLTKEGEFLRDTVEGPLRNLEVALQDIRTMMSRGNIDGSYIIDIGVGLHPALSHIAAKQMIYRFQKDFPSVKLRLLEAHSESLSEWLEKGTIDFAVLDTPSTGEPIKDQLLAMEDLVLVCADQTHTTRRQEVFKFKELTDLPLILPGSRSGLRKLIEDIAHRSKISLNVPYEVDSLFLQMELVAEGKGYSLMPLSLARYLVTERSFRFFFVTKPEIEVGTYLATRGSFGDVAGTGMSRIFNAIRESVMDCTTGTRKVP